MRMRVTAIRVNMSFSGVSQRKDKATDRAAPTPAHAIFLKSAVVKMSVEPYPKYRPVMLLGLAATCSGVPVATMRPPLSPPPGPMSMIQSALAITSRSCSMTTTVAPLATSRSNTPAAHARRAGADRWSAHRTRIPRPIGLCPFRWRASTAGLRRPKAPASVRRVSDTQDPNHAQGGQTCVDLLEVVGHGQCLIHAHCHELGQTQ